jgi:solute:Na+ symporter, SSS family
MKTPDYIVFFIYFIIVSSYGWYVYKKKKHEDSKDYFLAKDSLTWWAIGASLIASNISAEQFIGMSGSGFTMGLAIAAYEWLAAITLLIVAVFFIPIYLKNKIYTMPQFLKTRYNDTVAMIMAVFWLLLYVVVNLTSILFLGALAISSISGLDFGLCMIALAVFAVIITLGGMNVIGYTDVIQVVFLILGGLVTTYLALDMVAEHYGSSGALNGFNLMTENSADHFKMIFKKNDPYYMDLPGLAILVGGMWIVNLNYWGCNQYITQRALGADLQTARSGILFAAFLKLLMPVIVVLPGIAAFTTEMTLNGEVVGDRAYPVLLNLLPVGLKGLSFAALTAAVVASLAGKANSIATIFTLDIYKKKINPSAGEQKQVQVGRWVIVISMIMAVAIAPYLGIDKKGGFQYIQEYTGFVSPGIFAMFILGFFWKKTTSNAALFATIGGFILSVLFKISPNYVDLEFLYASGYAIPNAEGVFEIPFIDRMGFVFVICVVFMYIISMYENRNGVITDGLEIDKSMFRPTAGFTVGALIVIGFVVAIYAIYW